MLLDHVRETFFLHRQVSDPMDVTSTGLDLFLSRTLAHFCAPLFVFLTGLSAYLYGERHAGKGQVAGFLFKRGLVLIALELTLVNFAWTFQFPPAVIYLQVIWAIGLSMLALAVLVALPRGWLAAVGLVIIAGHNLLDDVHFAAGSRLHIPWAILHDRGWVEVLDSLRLRTSYPVLPWIGVIAVGYAAGPWFASGSDPDKRELNLMAWGFGILALFLALRSLNGYGEHSWVIGETTTQTVMSIFNITKYPPSLLFISLTLGVGLLLLAWMERSNGQRWLKPLAIFGAAPMFFYLLHLYVLKCLYVIALAIWGASHGNYYGFDSMAAVWACAVVLSVLLFPAVRWFAELKARRRDIHWLKYF
ncbi:heparan-alpha-glucosaminide N-acetyltransferase domain-containing protein [Pseudomonas abietaniphila]